MVKLKHFNIDEVLNSYLETLLWVDVEFDGYSIIDVCDDSTEISRLDIINFIKEIEKSNEAIEEANTYTDSLLGHNFLLSRNGHGAGFFDDNNDVLQEICRKTKECNIYLGDDKQIHIF